MGFPHRPHTLPLFCGYIHDGIRAYQPIQSGTRGACARFFARYIRCLQAAEQYRRILVVGSCSICLPHTLQWSAHSRRASIIRFRLAIAASLAHRWEQYLAYRLRLLNASPHTMHLNSHPPGLLNFVFSLVYRMLFFLLLY
jgi:hypothetical protein